MNDHEFPGASPDLPGQIPGELSSPWISVPEAAQQLVAAGLPRNKRTIRRYCERGDLDCRKTENALHQPQYFIDPKSVETYIAQQRTLLSSHLVASGLVRAEPDETGASPHTADAVPVAMNNRDTSEPDRTEPVVPGHTRSAANPELLQQLAARLEDKDQEIAFLRSELLHRRTTDSALHDVIAAFRANAEAQRLAAAPIPEGQGTTHREPPMQ